MSATRNFPYDNWRGRDALAIQLKCTPSVEDMRAYQAHYDDRDRLDVSPADQLYRALRRQAFLRHCPSVDPSDQAPDRLWKLKQQEAEFEQPIAIVTGLAEFKLTDGDPPMTLQRGKVRVPYMTGDDHSSPTQLTETNALIDSLCLRLEFERRAIPDPVDIPKGPLDVLPIGFYPLGDEHVIFKSGNTAGLHGDFCAEAGYEHMTDLYKQLVQGCHDYRVWMARAIAAMASGDYPNADQEALVLLRCIGISVGMEKTRSMLAELVAFYLLYAQPPLKFNGPTMTLLQAMYGSTYFPSVFFNLDDLCRETLELSDFADGYPALLWCY